MTPIVLTSASARFEAARQVDALPVGHRCRELHGHGFHAAVFAALPDAWAPFPGGEVEALRRHLEQVVAPLDYAHLNRFMSQPTDMHIALWIRERLALPGALRIAVRSTADEGVDLARDGSARVWRRYRFQAAHRLPRVPPAHKCGRMHGHGFEVVVHVANDPGSEAIDNDAERIDAAWSPLHATLDHRCLNDIEGLANPTSEIIAAWLWQRLQARLPRLCGVTVFETGACGASFDGQRHRIWKDFTLDSAVQLKRAPPGSAPSALHGHTYLLRLQLCAPLDDIMGWMVDFGDVKAIFDPVFNALDHRPLHEIAELQDADTASVAEWIFRSARAGLPQLVRVDLYETPGCGSVVATDIGGPALPA